MIDRQRLRDQLSKHEDRRRFAYDDATGLPISKGSTVQGIATVGVGRNLVTRGLSDDEIDYMLDNDIASCIAEAGKLVWFSTLDPVRQAAVVELLFNLGWTRLLGFKKFLKAMGEHQWMAAADELRDSLWFKQVGKRADTLIAQIVTGEWQ